MFTLTRIVIILEISCGCMSGHLKLEREEVKENNSLGTPRQKKTRK